MKKIALTKGQFAIVDDADYAWLNQWKWYASWNEDTKSFYAARRNYISPRIKGDLGQIVSMHREILGLVRGDRRHADHKETGNTLDNRRTNLRIATRSQNQANQRIKRTNTSGYKGVSWNKAQQNWRAQIQHNGKNRALGYYDTPQAAYVAYCQAAVRLHGEFARIV